MALIQQFGGKMLEKPTSSKEIGWYRISAREQFSGYQLNMLTFSSISQKDEIYSSCMDGCTGFACLIA